MLIEFRVENHRSLRDEQALSLEAGRGDGDDGRCLRQVAGHKAALLPVVALYGANASGKSNVLAALAFMRDAVWNSQPRWAPDGGVPREPFAWGGGLAKPSMFEVTFLADGARYQYGFVVDDQRVLEEWLFAWPNGRKQTWFVREQKHEASVFKFGEHLGGENRQIEQITRPNALFLSAARQYSHTRLVPVHQWWEGLSLLNLRSNRLSFQMEVSGADWLKRLLAPPISNTEDERRRVAELEDQVLPPLRTLLAAADTGIDDIRIDYDASFSESGVRRLTSQIMLHHIGLGDAGWLPLEAESKGTRTMLNIAPSVLSALGNGGTVCVDELEASLHPNLAKAIVERFNDPATNPHNAQLIFTTHNTHLLGTLDGEPTLRRDQVWFTEKDAEGATTLYPLTDLKPRRGENRERGYLQGRYGAVPFLGELTDKAG